MPLMNPFSAGSLIRGPGALGTTIRAGKSALATSQTAAALAPHMRRMLDKLKDFTASDLATMMARAGRFVEGLKSSAPGPASSHIGAGHTMAPWPGSGNVNGNRLQREYRADQAAQAASRPVLPAPHAASENTERAMVLAREVTGGEDLSRAVVPHDPTAHLTAHLANAGMSNANAHRSQYADGAPGDGGRSPGPAGASANAHIHATTNATGNTDTAANKGERQFGDGAPHDGGRSPWPAGIGEHPTPADFIPHIFQQAGDILTGTVRSGEHSGMLSDAFANSILHHVMPGLTQLSTTVAPSLARFDDFWKKAYQGAESGDPGQAQESLDALNAFRKHSAAGAANALGLLDSMATPEQQRNSREREQARRSE